MDLKTLREHVRLCPLGWHAERLMKTRTTTETDVIRWLAELRELVGLDQLGGRILPDSADGKQS